MEIYLHVSRKLKLPCMLITRVSIKLLKLLKTIGRSELISAFVKICKWLKMNKLALNVLKTEFMIIGTSHIILNILEQTPETTPYIITVDGCQIRRVKSVKYLGLIVDDTIAWD